MSMNCMRNRPVKQSSIRKSFEPCTGHNINNPKEYILIAILPSSCIQKHFTGYNNVEPEYRKKTTAEGDIPTNWRQDAVAIFCWIREEVQRKSLVMMVMNWFLTPQGPATVSSLQAAFLVCWQMQSWRQISKTALYRPGHLRQGLFMSSQALWSCLPCFWGNRFSAGWWLSEQILSNLGSSAAGFLCPALLSPSSFSILALAQLCTNIACPKSTSFASTWLCSPRTELDILNVSLGARVCLTIVISPFPFPPLPPSHLLWFPCCLQYPQGVVKT